MVSDMGVASAEEEEQHRPLTDTEIVSRKFCIPLIFLFFHFFSKLEKNPQPFVLILKLVL